VLLRPTIQLFSGDALSLIVCHKQVSLGSVFGQEITPEFDGGPVTSNAGKTGDGCRGFQDQVKTLAAPGFDEVHIRHSVRPGDRLSCTITWVEKREALSHHDRAIVRSVASLSDQQGEVVFSAVVTTLVAKRPR